MNKASLLFHTGPLAGKGLKIKNETAVIGRSSSCDISISDASISREHAKINFENGQWVIRDLGSHNGIKTEEGRVEQLVLINGVKFRLGTIEIEFWDGTSAPSIATQGPISAEVNHNIEVQNQSVVNEVSPGNINELKHKRMTNIIILISIVSMVLIIFSSLFYFMNKVERPVAVSFLKMYTDEDRIVDLNFTPIGEKEKFLSPFVVNDYTSISCEFQNIYLDKDIFILKEGDITNPTMSSVLGIKTKMKTGAGKISFYIGEDEKKLVGILNLEVVRRPVPEVINNFINADFETKKAIAEDLYQQAIKYEEDPSKNVELWNVLKNGKTLFENGDAKPEIYSKIDSKFLEFNKKIERTNKSMFDQYEIDRKQKDYQLCLNTLEKIIKINPDEENLYKQKAKIYERRIRKLLYKGGRK